MKVYFSYGEFSHNDPTPYLLEEQEKIKKHFDVAEIDEELYNEWVGLLDRIEELTNYFYKLQKENDE